MEDGNPYDPDWTPDDDDGFDYQDDEPSDDDLDEIDEEFGEQMDDIMQHFEAESQEFNEAEVEFTEKYGFVHNCRCDKDWEEGNLGVVSVCYLGMVTDALDTLATTREEVKDANRAIAKLRIELAAK